MTTEPRSLLEAQSISVDVVVPRAEKPLRVVDRASLSIWPGVSYAISGRSGSGKTSLLSVLGLLNTNYGGSLRVDGVDVSGLPDRDLAVLRARSFGFVFQNYSLVPHLTALANVVLPCAYARLGRVAALANARQSLSDVGLAGKMAAKPVQLSGGEQQRVAIARAMAAHPRVVLADEPTGALDTETGEAVMRALLERVGESGTALVVVTHDSDVAAHCQQQYVMERGTLSRADSVSSIPTRARRALPFPDETLL